MVDAGRVDTRDRNTTFDKGLGSLGRDAGKVEVARVAGDIAAY